jgi:hypothetical protein
MLVLLYTKLVVLYTATYTELVQLYKATYTNLVVQYTATYTNLVKLYTATYTTGAATVYCVQFFSLVLYTVYRVVYQTWLQAVYAHHLSS